MSLKDALFHFRDLGYYVDDQGNVFNPRGKILRCSTNKDGYKRITTRMRNHPVHGDWCPKVEVHRLAGYQKFGDKIFTEGLEICHDDGDKRNNAKDNLRLDTHKSNMMDVPQEVRINRARRAGREHAKLTDEQVAHIRSSGMTLKQIMQTYGISKSGASYVRSGKTYASPCIPSLS